MAFSTMEERAVGRLVSEPEDSVAKQAKIDSPVDAALPPSPGTSRSVSDTEIRDADPGRAKSQEEPKLTFAEEKKRAAEKEELRRKDPKERKRLRERLNDLKTKDIRKWLREVLHDGNAQSDLQFRERPLTKVFPIDLPTHPPHILDVLLTEKEMAPYFESEASKLFSVSYTNVEKSIHVVIHKAAWMQFLQSAGKTEKAKMVLHEYEVSQALLKLNKRDVDLADGLAHWKVANNVLKRLDILDLANELIKKTKIGLAVNPYQHHSDPNVGKLAKQLLKKWRDNYKLEKSLFGAGKDLSQEGEKGESQDEKVESQVDTEKPTVVPLQDD